MQFRLGIFAALLAAVSVTAQQQPPPTFRTGTQIVSLFVTVTDAQRRLVPDLSTGRLRGSRQRQAAADRAVREQETSRSRVVVMLDTSGSMTGSLSLLRDAAEQFLIRLFPDDKAKVGAFNDKIEVSATFHQRPRRSGWRNARTSTTATARGCSTRSPSASTS